MSSSHHHGHAHHHHEPNLPISVTPPPHTEVAAGGVGDPDSSIAWAALRRVGALAPVLVALWLLVFWAHSTPSP